MIPKSPTMGIGPKIMAMNPIEVASIATSTAGPVFVMVVLTASASGAFLISSSSLEWIWMA
ncbi:MAG: hypothetical protein A4E42_00676 [Methanoregulaceae archaeon PtaU1.Bin222]|nr:MAG: hypothetical protein A4E42_00676 [Methanoregulaceae archaeon PtaU1.Bin222]